MGHGVVINQFIRETQNESRAMLQEFYLQGTTFDSQQTGWRLMACSPAFDKVWAMVQVVPHPTSYIILIKKIRMSRVQQRGNVRWDCVLLWGRSLRVRFWLKQGRVCLQAELASPAWLQINRFLVFYIKKTGFIVSLYIPCRNIHYSTEYNIGRGRSFSTFAT